MFIRTLFSTLLCLLLALPAAAQQTAEQFLATLKFQDGRITLPGSIATLDLPAGFRYLDPDDSTRLLTDGWGNPPGPKTLGMIVPAAVSPLSAEGWGVVITYEKDGHVNDSDANDIKYDELLKSMQDSVAADNDERKKQGYAPMTLVGWAETPRYDKASHKLYWAKELHTGDDKHNALNYNIRVLGREGVLVLNAVAGMDQISRIRSEMKTVTAFTDFTPGHRYTDFDSKTDKVAEYGIAALIAGGAAAKLGLFGKLFALLLAFKKVILLGVAAVGGWLWKLVGGRKKVDLSKPK
ncbi:putative membrane-anchored protein [Pseudoduganella flava]|uniref:DUF2167 domain-containing protein n=1 Tax=Pseudoduganella flava TaxID=871742 RepID=A0A562PLF0_9BURK|nr:DUF2167 domain-containing protein [Pseudoduganella flava]QGZ41021.1 DUF2167 domain-containing protein [Pseudoduganella flava]TWI45285.1 putative membrane-anchored protein [Pseudoduganella flava]